MFALTGSLEEGTRLEINFEASRYDYRSSFTEKQEPSLWKQQWFKKLFSSTLEEKPIETLKEEIVSMVQEEMPFMQILEEVAPPVWKQQNHLLKK